MRYTCDEESKEAVLDMICMFLEGVVAQGQLPAEEYNVTPFDAVQPPKITVTRYFKDRIAKYSNCSMESLVMSLIYMDRIVRSAHTTSPSRITATNVHRLIICSAMLAAKFFDDEYYDNAYFARVGGISTQELNNLELHFLSCINFDLFVSTAEFKSYFFGLSTRAQYSAGMQAVPVPTAVPIPNPIGSCFPMDVMEMDGVGSFGSDHSPKMDHFLQSVY